MSGLVDHGASAGPRPQELVERALDLSQAEACVVIGEAVSDANLRWANNTLTTNGLTRSNQLTVIAVSGGAVGVVSRSGVTLDSLESLVRAAEQTARTSPEAEDVAPLVAGDTPGGGWDDPPADHRRPRLHPVRGGAGRGLRPGLRRRGAPLRLRGARAAHHVCRLVHRVAGPPRPTDRPRGDQRQVRRLRSVRLGGGGHRRLRRCGRGAGHRPT